MIIRAKMVPGRAGTDTRVDVHIALADLRAMDGASVLEEAWLAARAGQHGYLSGKDAETIACDALIVPIVTGSPGLGRHRRDDRPGPGRLRQDGHGQDASGAVPGRPGGTGTAGTGTGTGSAGLRPARPLPPEAWGKRSSTPWRNSRSTSCPAPARWPRAAHRPAPGPLQRQERPDRRRVAVVRVLYLLWDAWTVYLSKVRNPSSGRRCTRGLSETYDAAESVPTQLANGERHAARRGWHVVGPVQG